MISFDSIRCIYYFPDLVRIFKESCQFCPVFVPWFENVGILFIPFFAEFFLCIFGIIKVDCTVYFLQIGTYLLSVLIWHKLTAVPYLMNYAELIFCSRKYGIYCIAKTCQIIMTSYENVHNTAAFQVWTYACIKACRFIFRHPCSKNFFVSGHCYPQHRIHAFLYYPVVFPSIEYHSVKENYGINFLKRTILPLIYFGKYFVSYSRNKSLRYFRSVDLTQCIFYIPLRHSFGIHRHYFLFDLVGSGLSFFDDLRFKISVSVSRNRYLTIAVVALYRFFAIAVPAVSGIISENRVLFVSKMFIHFCFEYLLDRSREQFFQHLLYISGSLTFCCDKLYKLCFPFIQTVYSLCHKFFSFQIYLWLLLAFTRFGIQPRV